MACLFVSKQWIVIVLLSKAARCWIIFASCISYFSCMQDDPHPEFSQYSSSLITLYCHILWHLIICYHSGWHRPRAPILNCTRTPDFCLQPQLLLLKQSGASEFFFQINLLTRFLIGFPLGHIVLHHQVCCWMGLGHCQHLCYLSCQ